MTQSLPLAVTIGDAAGVGPELVLTAGRTLATEGPLVAYGSAALLEAALASIAPRYAPSQRFSAVVAIGDPSEVTSLPADVLGVVECPITRQLPRLDPYPWGLAVPAFGELQYEAVVKAVEDALGGRVSALLTAPWHKARLADAGLKPTGHTEVLRERADAPDVVMMLAGDILRVALVTIHLALADVPKAVTQDAIVSTVRTVDRGLREQFGTTTPRIVVCGLNPHAGEVGVMGTEDERVVAPAIAELRATGIDATGPYPADTLFPRVVAGLESADAVVAMYHDQGLIPLKTVHFGSSANITLGLPFVRASVDHGTAYDIAGKGTVAAGSFLYAGRFARTATERTAG